MILDEWLKEYQDLSKEDQMKFTSHLSLRLLTIQGSTTEDMHSAIMLICQDRGLDTICPRCIDNSGWMKGKDDTLELCSICNWKDKIGKGKEND